MLVGYEATNEKREKLTHCLPIAMVGILNSGDDKVASLFSQSD
jgi:hypothetical protein